MKPTQRIYQQALQNPWLQPKDVAVLIRAALASKFPGVKFSVTTSVYSMGSSIDVRWTDGPRCADVNALAKQYQFAEFDGSIDLSASIDHWLAPDGSISLAHAEGTQGSKGCVPEAIGDPHHPGAVLVKGGAKHVFVRRELSPAVQRRIAGPLALEYGLTLPDDDNALPRMMNATRIGDSWLDAVVRNLAEQPETATA